MTTVPAIAILNAAAALAGEVIRPDLGDTFAPDADTMARFTARLSEHLPSIWGRAAWPELVEVQRRRQVATAVSYQGHYPILSDVWHAESNRSYRAMVDGADGKQINDVGQWVHLRGEYPASRFDPTKTYVPGEVIYYNDPAILYYYNANVQAAPLLPFDPSIAKVQRWAEPDMGDILRVTMADPRVHECPGDLPYELNGSGVRVGGDPGSAWFTFRRPCPLVQGRPFDSAVSYLPGDQMFWALGTRGDYYDVLFETLPGQTPATQPEKFAVVPLPARFAQWLSAMVSADWLRWDRQQEKAMDREAAAQREMDRLLLNLGTDQRQTRQLAVRSDYYRP